MIQRIQTVFLLLIAGLMLAILFFPLGCIVSPHDPLMIDVRGIHGPDGSLVSEWALYILPVCSALLSIVSIFLYKRRKLQINICYLTIFSMVMFYVFFLMYTWTPGQSYAHDIRFYVTILFPAIGIILEFFAIRGIKKDEKLIRSLDRLR